jgi:hypothetical protein
MSAQARSAEGGNEPESALQALVCAPCTVRLEWFVNPSRKSASKTSLLVIFLILTCILVYIAFHSMVLTVISALLLAGSLIKFFISTRYSLNQESVEIITPFGKTVKKWESFKSFYPDKNGIFLSPFEGKSRLENFRGLYLLFNGNEKEVTEFVKGNIKTVSEK